LFRDDEDRKIPEKIKGNNNLRSTREVLGYHIQATDTDIGHVEDFIVDQDTWIIRYLVIDTSNWLPASKKVLITPSWVDQVEWDKRKVPVDLTSDQIRNSPPFDPTLPVNQEYEVALYDFYGRPYDW